MLHHLNCLAKQTVRKGARDTLLTFDTLQPGIRVAEENVCLPLK